MKELLLLLLVAPFGILAALNTSLSTFQPITSPASLPVIINAPIIPVPTASAVQDLGPRVDALITAARTWLGTPYLWGGCTRHGVDCSCFMVNIFATIGVGLPRITTQQIAYATPVSQSQAVAGDLVFFDNTCINCGANPTHEGLYIGNGVMIDAGNPVRQELVYGGHNARYGRVLR